MSFFQKTSPLKGRLVRATFGARSTLYKVNGLGQRVMKSGRGAPLGPHRYVYDEQGRLLGDYDKTGTAMSEMVYLGEMPVAVLTDGQVYYLHADHLNTPRVMTDTSNRTVWRWRLIEPFGDNAAEQDPDRDGQKFTYNLRFAGQYFDKETNLHYNGHRDYDSTSGRYMQSDPIGLDSGINTYTYVYGNPLRWIDPFGLMGNSPGGGRPSPYCGPRITSGCIPRPPPPPVEPELTPSCDCDAVLKTCILLIDWYPTASNAAGNLVGAGIGARLIGGVSGRVGGALPSGGVSTGIINGLTGMHQGGLYQGCQAGYEGCKKKRCSCQQRPPEWGLTDEFNENLHYGWGLANQLNANLR